MKVVSIINYKGGVGKTTLAANMGAELAWRGRRVLLIDTDSQSSLTFSFIAPDHWEKNFSKEKTIKSWFDGFDAGKEMPLSDLIFSPPKVAKSLGGRGALDLISSHLGLINVDLELATQIGGANLGQAKRNWLKVHRRLADGIAGLDSDLYDYVLIDCPPNFNIVTKTAIVASDFILIPARPDYLSTLGIDYLLRSVGELIKDYNDYVAVDNIEPTQKIRPINLGVLFTMIREYRKGPISAQRGYIAQIRSNKKLNVFKSYVKRNDTVFADAPEYGIPVVLRGYNSHSHRRVVEGLERCTTEFENSVR